MIAKLTSLQRHFGRTAAQTFSAFAIFCGLCLSAQAQIGSGWASDGETYIPQSSPGTTITAISGGYEFTTPSGLGRAEMRGNNLPTTTTNQWQGLGTLVSFPSGSNKICMHQVFGPDPSTPDLILDEATYSGGIEIMSLEQSDAFEAQIQVGVQFQLNTIYDPVGSLITIYVNGSLTGTKVPNSGIHYNKYGQYVSSSGTGPSTFDWVNIQSWAGGSATGSGTVAAPTFSPPAGTYTSVQSVTLSSTTTGATIRYTTDGTTPTETNGTVYFSAVTVSIPTTIKAIAFESSFTDSTVSTSAYTINLPQVAAPTFSPAAGTYTSVQSVTLSSTTTGATIRYTTDGSTPTETNGTVYSTPVAIGATTTLNAIAYESGFADSTVSTAAYTLNLPGVVSAPVFSPAASTYTSAQAVTITSATSGASIRYTTDGSTPTETNGTVYSGAVSISTTTSLKAIAYASGLADSAVTSGAFTINIPTPTPASPASGGGGAFDGWFLGFLAFAGLCALKRTNNKGQ